LPPTEHPAKTAKLKANAPKAVDLITFITKDFQLASLRSVEAGHLLKITLARVCVKLQRQIHMVGFAFCAISAGLFNELS
jgi:hypothetical protein